MSQALFPARRVLWMPLETAWTRPSGGVTHCCPAMTDALEFRCEQHEDPFACADALLVYNEIMDEYGLVIHDGTASYVLIDHCPWCGTRLPESARDRWFDAIDALDLSDDAAAPPDFLSGQWRSKT